MPAAHQSDRLFLFLTTCFALAGVIVWDATSLDIVLARVMGEGERFSLRDHWFFTDVLHDGARRASTVLAAALILAVWWPVGLLRRLDMQSRLQLAATPLLVSLAISALKWFSLTSCPWDLSLFGGSVPYTSHWSVVADGGPGHCFPAGHASAGFAFIGGYFVFRHVSPRTSRIWLQASLASGFLLGVAQQWRGAHFMSHTLWTGIISWCIAMVVDSTWQSLRRKR